MGTFCFSVHKKQNVPNFPNVAIKEHGVEQIVRCVAVLALSYDVGLYRGQ
jgi:hypothetical protein